jgi:hypothetical protein
MGSLCIARDERLWRRIIMGHSPDFAYQHTEAGWVYDGARSC